AGGDGAVGARHDVLGDYWVYAEGQPALLFCDNETNARRLFGATSAGGYFKDAFHEYVVNGDQGAVCPQRTGTKAAAHYSLLVPPGSSVRVRLRSCNSPGPDPFLAFDEVVARRRREADEFYAELQKDLKDADARLVQRQALAGMIWNKQLYHYEIRHWLQGDPAQPPPPPQRREGRNADWLHLDNGDVLSMPDKWEYPWYAAWDLGFHCVALA